MQAMSLNFALSQKENISFTTCDAHAIDIRVIFHINDTLNDSQKFLICKFMKNLTTRVANNTQIYFPYSTVTSACNGSRLACTRTVSVTVNQQQLYYSTNIHLLIPRFMKSMCVITIKLNTLTDVPYQMTVGVAFVYVCERGRDNGRVYITQSVITQYL